MEGILYGITRGSRRKSNERREGEERLRRRDGVRVGRGEEGDYGAEDGKVMGKDEIRE